MTAAPLAGETPTSGSRRRPAPASTLLRQRDPRARRRARGHGGRVPRARAPPARVARGRRAPRGRRAASRRGPPPLELFAEELRAAQIALGGDHRRIHRRRSAGRRSFRASASANEDAPGAPLVQGCGGLAVGAAAGWLCSRVHTPIPVDAGAARRARVAARRGRANRRAARRPPGRAVDHRHGARPVLHAARRARSRRMVAAARRRRGIRDRRWATPRGVARAPRAASIARPAIFASVPGGAAEMSVLGERFGARVDRVAAAQSLRILIVVLVGADRVCAARRARRRPVRAGDRRRSRRRALRC